MFRSGLDRTPSTTTFDMTRKVIIIICEPHIRIVNCMLPQNEPDSNHVSFSSHLCRLKWMVVRCATVCLSITRRSIRVVNLVSFDSRTEIVGNIRGEPNYILTYHHISKISVLSCWHSWIFTLTVVNLVLYALSRRKRGYNNNGLPLSMKIQLQEHLNGAFQEATRKDWRNKQDINPVCLLSFHWGS